jgi:hypothetical protein
MRGGLKFRILVVGIIAAAACLVAAGAGIADTTNADPTGDATGGAPDITQVVTSNDAAGVITFRITTVAPIIDSSEMLIALNTDSNPGTGAGGAEYLLIAGTGGFGILKWNGTTFAQATAPSLSMTRSGNLVEFKINRADLGVTDRFGLSVLTLNFDATDTLAGEDDAPDGGEYIYTMTLTQCANGKDDDGDGKVDGDDLGCSSPTDNLESDDPVTLKAGKALTIPAKPKAGKVVVVGAAVVRLETGAGIPSGTVKCAVHVGTKALPAIGKVSSGVAACKFTLPKTSKGKMARGTISVTFKGKSVKVPFAFKVN